MVQLEVTKPLKMFACVLGNIYIDKLLGDMVSTAKYYERPVYGLGKNVAN